MTVLLPTIGTGSPATTTMVALSSFYPFILPSVPGAPEPLVDQALVATAIRFCRETNCVQLINPPMDVTAYEPEYAVAEPVDLKISRILKIWHIQTALTPMVPDLVDSGLAIRGDIGTLEVERGTPRLFYQNQPDDSTFKLFPVPDTTVVAGLTLRVAFKPIYGATSLPETLLMDWVQEFTAGVRAMLHRLPNYPFTDLARAEAENQDFQNGLRAASIQTNTGNLRGALRVRANPLF